MSRIDTLITTAFVVAGIVILVLALRIIQKIIVTIPVHQDNWRILRASVVLFIVGYAAYGAGLWTHALHASLFITGIVFLFGAGFVYLISRMSFGSITELRKLVELQRAAITDPLMGIYNRRFLYHRLEEEVARAQRYGTPLSILMIDLDHFKNINDRYGHQTGDRVLQEIARMIQHGVRKSDYVGRFGGEELLLILPVTTKEEAEILAEKLRRKIEQAVLVPAEPGTGNEDVRCTVSIGIAGFDRERHPTAAELIADADAALYRAKEGGRNRTCR